MWFLFYFSCFRDFHSFSDFLLILVLFCIFFPGTHQKLKDFLPEQLKDLIFTTKIKEEPIEATNGKFPKFLSFLPFFFLSLIFIFPKNIFLLFYFTEDTTELPWKCCVCKKGFEARIPLTQHIVEHFQSKILDSYVESGTKCKICKYHDANTIQLTRHVALQHEKIREFIPTGIFQRIHFLNFSYFFRFFILLFFPFDISLCLFSIFTCFFFFTFCRIFPILLFWIFFSNFSRCFSLNSSRFVFQFFLQYLRFFFSFFFSRFFLPFYLTFSYSNVFPFFF